jgi:hypothetical protein
MNKASGKRGSKQYNQVTTKKEAERDAEACSCAAATNCLLRGQGARFRGPLPLQSFQGCSLGASRMKVKVKYEAEGEWFKLRDRQRKKFEPKVIEYDLNTDIPLVKHIETIWRLVNAQDSPEKYCIYIEEEDAYLNEESHLKAQLSYDHS